MAKNISPADKAAKQKKILIGLGVLMLVVGGIQVPRLMGGSDSSSTAGADTTATGASADGATPAPAAVSATPAPTPAAAKPVTLLPGESRRQAPTATLVGVRIAGSSTVRAAEGQLTSFSLFEPKDPFSPQLKEGLPSATVGVAAAPKPAPAGRDAADAKPEPPVAPAAVTPSPQPAPVTSGGLGSDGAATAPAGGQAPEKAPVVPPTYATIVLNGVAHSLELGDAFPEDEPMFVLVKVKAAGIAIGIFGGKLEKGKLAPVPVGEWITLVDSATGVRYTIEALSVGTEPDLEFTTAGTTAATPPTP